ncbi:two-component system activity regulator YycH [Sporolactobacillus shoreicorticis]|uniref:YycH family regulatory protein n=1 Tax=Sporolactobacillus shoreicorticis TaxID=1923877 RepID=A0ABW5S860_9BACL|nr:two-component system activity regulator YycH [Sporolactobacillus shoreicorticis]MCO7126073.1 two-component system activity regulator YycH [Sporolactobacillus shoreicorticis]
MHREVFKSVLLGVLVLASVAMTFNILFYKSDFQNYNPNSTKQVAIAKEQKIPEVIRPNLMLERNKNGAFGQNGNRQIQKVYTLLRQCVFSEQSSSNSDKDDSENTHYELVFPAPLTFDALSKVFQFDNSKSLSTNHMLVDRIDVFSSSNGRNVTAIFSSQNERNKFYTTVDHLNINSLKALYGDADLRPYERLTLKGKIVYLPQEKTKVDSEVSYYERLSLEKFIPILFTDPDNVFAAKGKTEYTDSERQMERTNNIIQFVNPGITSTSEQKQDPILGSFDWVNSVKLWTDDYIYQGISLKNYRGDGTVSFRMTIGDYMVFNTETYPNWYLSMIELTWRSGELSNYKGTLFDLNPVDSQGSMTLDSGKEILDQLSQANVHVKSIEDLAIGYELKNPASGSDQSIVATPDWFYKIGGRWYSASDALMPAHGINGKEDPS